MVSNNNPIDEESVLNEINKALGADLSPNEEVQSERLYWVVVSELIVNTYRVRHYYTAGPFTILEDADAVMSMLDETSLGKWLVPRIVSGFMNRSDATETGMTLLAAHGYLEVV
jgi:hypothetical protein